MRNRNRLAAMLLGAACILATGALANPDDFIPKKPPPVQTDRQLGFYGLSRDQLRASVKRVGLLPVELPEGLGERDDARKAIEDLVASYLSEAGFEVVRPDVFRASYDRFNRQMGGIYDPKTGLLKEREAAAVYLNARRDYISREHLDACVTLRVLGESVDFKNMAATWDGARERIDGIHSPDFYTRNYKSDVWAVGNISVLTLRLQIVTHQDQVAYARDGGIQLTNYYRTTNEGQEKVGYWNYQFGFVPIPRDDLLRDEKRMERAVRAATVPLLRTPQEISQGWKNKRINTEKLGPKDLPEPPKARDEVPAPALRVPRDQILASVKRVALTPLSTGTLDVPADARARIMSLVRSELAPLGWELIDSPTASEILGGKVLASEVFDPLTGKRDELRASEARKSAFGELGTKPLPEAIVWLRLVQMNSRYQYGVVVWDGVDQNAITRAPAPVSSSSYLGREGQDSSVGSGSISVSSIEVRITDRNDTLLYETRGGLEILQILKVVKGGRFEEHSEDTVDLAPGELFRDADRQKQAVHLALRALVMTPEALNAELNPDTGKSRERLRQ